MLVMSNRRTSTHAPRGMERCVKLSRMSGTIAPQVSHAQLTFHARWESRYTLSVALYMPW